MKSEDRRKQSIKKNSHKKLLKNFLVKYDVSFSRDLDEIWDEVDDDKNGFLDKKEAKTFLDEVTRCVQKDRAKNYNKNDFEKTFEKFDEDKNGYLTKGEMSQFIKLAF